MAKYVRSRNSDQCRSHHQKLITYHSTIPQIISHYHDVVFKRMEGIWKNVGRGDSSTNIAKPKEEFPTRSFYSLEVSGPLIRIEIDTDSILSLNYWMIILHFASLNNIINSLYPLYVKFLKSKIHIELCTYLRHTLACSSALK